MHSRNVLEKYSDKIEGRGLTKTVLIKDNWVSENHWHLEHEHKSVKTKMIN